MQYLSAFITVVFGLYLIILLVLTAINKDAAIHYFSSFATTAKAHYLEQAIRLILGSALVVSSIQMLGTPFFYLLGWVLISTSILLLIIPWKIHHRFGKWAIPLTIKYIWFYASLAAILGISILYSIIYPIYF